MADITLWAKWASSTFSPKVGVTSDLYTLTFVLGEEPGPLIRGQAQPGGRGRNYPAPPGGMRARASGLSPTRARLVRLDGIVDPIQFHNYHANYTTTMGKGSSHQHPTFPAPLQLWVRGHHINTLHFQHTAAYYITTMGKGSSHQHPTFPAHDSPYSLTMQGWSRLAIASASRRISDCRKERSHNIITVMASMAPTSFLLRWRLTASHVV